MRMGSLFAVLGLCLWAGAALADETADLTVTIESARTTDVHAGQKLGFTVLAGNAGPGDVVGAHVHASFPTSMAGMVWTCEASEGVSCPPSGSGDVDLVLDLPVGAVAVFSGVGTAVSQGNAVVSASVSGPDGMSDADVSNNNASLETEVGAAVAETDPSTPSPTLGEVSPQSDGCQVGGGQPSLLGLLVVGAFVAFRRRAAK